MAAGFLLFHWERGHLGRRLPSFPLGARPSWPPCLCGLEAHTPGRKHDKAALAGNQEIANDKMIHIRLLEHGNGIIRTCSLSYIFLHPGSAAILAACLLLFHWERGHLGRLAFAGWKPALPEGSMTKPD